MGVKKMEPRKELWTFDQLKAYLNIPRATIYLYISQGLIPSVRIGKHRRFIPDEVEKAIKRLPS